MPEFFDLLGFSVDNPERLIDALRALTNIDTVITGHAPTTLTMAE